MNDLQIIELYFERSERAVTETANKYGGYCYSIAYAILNDNEDAEESVNDTYLRAWNSIPPHRPTALSTFLGKITRRLSIDKWRRRNAEKRGGGEIPLVLDELRECLSNEDEVHKQIEKDRLAAIINSFVAGLSFTEQKVFLCRYWYMDSIDDISRRFGFSVSKVKSMLFRMRERLRVRLEREGLL